MTIKDLISAVASRYIEEHLEQGDDSTLRFCMVGIEPSLVVAIAQTVIKNEKLKDKLLIRINPKFDPEQVLPSDVKVMDESITYWRHCSLPEGKRAVLFAAAHNEIQHNDKSVEKITKIETDTLRSNYRSWIELGINLSMHPSDEMEVFIAILKSVDETYIARTIEMFADFVLSLGKNKEQVIREAVNKSLNKLHLPNGAGKFSKISDSKLTNYDEWKKIFQNLNNQIRPLLFLEDERGESIARKVEDNYKKLKSSYSEEQCKIIENFLKSDLSADRWVAEQQHLVELEWENYRNIFMGDERAPAGSLGKKTKIFLEDILEDELPSSALLILKSKLPNKPEQDHIDFYEEYREYLAKNRTLTREWEKYIYQNPQTYSNILVGMIETLHRLRVITDDSNITTRKFVVSIPDSNINSFWRYKNTGVITYLIHCLHGLDDLLGDDAEINFGKLMSGDRDIYNSGSRDARTIKFKVSLDPNGANTKMIFYWEMPVDEIATAMHDDLKDIVGEQDQPALFSTSEIARQSASSKGTLQKLHISNINSFFDARRENKGRLVSINNQDNDLGVKITRGISDLNEIVDTDVVKELKNKFESFSTEYTSAINELFRTDGKGLSSKNLIVQAEKYSELLQYLVNNVNNDIAREKVWRFILNIGTSQFNPGPPAAIVAPWHPLKLAELAVKAKQAVEIMKRLLYASGDSFDHAELMLSQIRKDLTSNYYPELCVTLYDGKPVLLTASETSYGYTLYEAADTNAGSDVTEIPGPDSKIAAKEFCKVGLQYLTLQPHERSNFSMVLYNSISETLPSEIVAEFSKMVDGDNDLNCELLLTHSDPKQMRKIYEQQNAVIISDTLRASETTRNFLSRLYVGFLNISELSKDTKIRPTDIVALRDVISKNSSLVWKKAPGKKYPNLLNHIPSKWSRRRPVGHEDTTSTVYLTSPSQPEISQIYLNTLYNYLAGSNALSVDVIPAYELNFNDGETQRILEQTHNLGEWVVNFDELVDHKLLRKLKVQVIRHIKDIRIDRKITVSTTAKSSLLDLFLRQRLQKINPRIINKYPDILKKFIDQANKLSGQVVMRAARQGHFANELLGIVLSMEEIKSRLGETKYPIGWYCLDDYVSWFGQKEEQIADIMALAPRLIDGNPTLDVYISEAKFISSASNLKSSMRNSSNQLVDTVNRIRRAIQEESQNGVNREIWFNLFGEFMLEGIKPFKANEECDLDLHNWSMELRNYKIPIRLIGLSHIFLHDENENVISSINSVKGTDECWQLVYNMQDVSKAITNFAKEQPFDAQVICEVNSNKKKGLQEQDTTLSTEDKSEIRTDDTVSVPVNKPDHEEVQVSSSAEPPVVEQWPSVEVSDWVNANANAEKEGAETEDWLMETKNKLMQALRKYDMSTEFQDMRITPNTGLFRFKGSDNLTVAKVEKRKEELLTTHALEVTNVDAALSQVIIKIARPKRSILSLQELWNQRKLPPTVPNYNASLLLGACEDDGRLLYLNLETEFGGYDVHAPHTLIAGETGSGKGILVQSLLLDICTTNSPTNAQLHMIDPKEGVDFPWLRNMPHLYEGQLVTKQNDAIDTFKILVAEMEKRYRLFSSVKARDLISYNKSQEADKDKLPRIWLFHDEFAEWMIQDDYRKSVVNLVNSLGLKARAAGINLVMVTQRPDKDAFPMQLRSNLGNRLVLKMADKLNSKLVLDDYGAERLLGRGHLIAKLNSKKIFVQVPFISEDEIDKLSGYICNAWKNRIGN